MLIGQNFKGFVLSTQLPLNIRIQDDTTFESFVVGENRAGVAWLQAMASGHEQYAYIWGESGVGRSHLLQAVCHAVGEQGHAALYLPLAHRQEWSLALLEDLESLQVVCLDDIDLVAGEPSWEEALMHLYNRLRDGTCGLVVSGHLPPSDLPIQLADLRSRLACGNVFYVKPLSDAKKIEALQAKAEKRGFSLPSDVALFLFKRTSRDTGELFSLLNRLDEASLRAKRRLTIPFVKEALEL